MLALKGVKGAANAWAIYQPKERRNIIVYIIGVVLYRFGLEIFNGSIITLAVDRIPPEHAFKILGALTAINQAMQFFGGILIVRVLQFFWH